MIETIKSPENTRPTTITERIKNGEVEVNDIDTFMGGLLESAERLSFSVENLATIGGYPLHLLQRYVSPGAPNLLIVSGLHGEEPAGPWGIRAFLDETQQEFLDRANVSIVPLVNATGFVAKTRYNRWKENPNIGYPVTESSEGTPSHEGQVLFDNLDRLLQLGEHGFLSLHEDQGKSHFYLFPQEAAPAPTKFSFALRAIGQEIFGLEPDGRLYDEEPYFVKDGMCFNSQEPDRNTFEDLLIENGIATGACTETPGKRPVEERIAVNQRLITTFIKLLNQTDQIVLREN